METTVCAYCYHEVEKTPDSVCSYCGGNLAEEPLEEIDDSSSSQITKVQEFLFGYPISRKSRRKLYASCQMESNLESIRRTLEVKEQKRRQSQVKKEMQELDNFTKVINESETVKTLVKSLDKSIIPFWLKVGGFLLGLVIGAFFAFPDIQIPLLETLRLINSSPYLIFAMSFIPILFLLIMVQKFERGMF